MPHSTTTNNNTTTTTKMSNNDTPNLKTSSTFLNHLTSYPLIHDTLSTLTAYSLVSKPLYFTADVYNRVSQPLEPYLKGPYSYAKPYVTRADELADSGLQHVETRFPIVKEDTGTVVQSGKDLLFMPLRVAGEGRDYVVGTWNDEYSKTLSHSPSQKASLQTSILALISTELKLASDFLQAVADVLAQQSRSQREQHGADAPTTKVNGQLATKFGGYGDAAQGLADKVSKQEGGGLFGNNNSTKAGEKADEAAKKAEGYAKAGQKKVQEGVEGVQQKAQQA